MRNFIILLAAITLCACGAKNEAHFSGKSQVWETLTLSFEGPQLSEARETFTDYVMVVNFFKREGPKQNGEIIDSTFYSVGGYFAADGNAAETGATSGNIWRAHFVPPAEGVWYYTVGFFKGDDIALDMKGWDRNVPHPESWGKAGYFHHAEGRFDIAPARLNPGASDFAQKGLLADVRGRYLQYQGTKDYFLKTGAGSPENLLAYSGFDGTYDAGGTNFPALGDNQLHEFAPHMRDAKPGDPTWQGGKGAAILGIANYYESVGVNAQYIVTMNVEGDGQDVWPWVSHTDPYVFDVSKLAQWERVLSHYNARGVLIDMLLSETENESWFEAFDGAQIGEDFAKSRKLYYREMVARFGHLNGLVWNIGEENGVMGNSGASPYRDPTSAQQRLAFAKYINDLDPYAHAIVSHNWPGSEEATYGEKLGVEYFSGISQQAHEDYNKTIVDWLARSKASGRQWMITLDEPLGWEFGARPDSDVDNREREIKDVLWPVLMAGGAGVDWYFGWQNNAPTSDLSNEDQRSRHTLWVESARVRRWWEANVPFWEMEGSHEMHGESAIYLFTADGPGASSLIYEEGQYVFTPAGAAGGYAIDPMNPK